MHPGYQSISFPSLRAIKSPDCRLRVQFEDMSGLESVWKIQATVKTLLGLAEYQNPRWVWAQRFYFGFLVTNLVVYISLFWWKSFASDQDIAVRVSYAFYGLIVFSFSSYLVLLVLFHPKIESFFVLFEKLTNEAAEGPSKNRFLQCEREATKLFRFTTVNIPIATCFTSVIQASILSLLKGKFEPHLPLYVHDNLANRLLTWVCSLLGEFVVLIAFQLIFNLIFVAIKYAIAAMDVIKIELRAAGVSEGELDRSFRVAVSLHCEVTEMLSDLFGFISALNFVFEWMNFAILLSVWLVYFFDRSIMLVAVSGLGVFGLFVVFCWINELLSGAFEDLQDVLYDLEWYKMTPKSRKMLQLVMIAARRPTLLTAGPFHTIGFESLVDLVNKAYSWGLILNDLIGKNF